MLQLTIINRLSIVNTKPGENTLVQMASQLGTFTKLTGTRDQFLKRKPPETSKKTSFLVKEKKLKKAFSLISDEKTNTRNSSNLPCSEPIGKKEIPPPPAIIISSLESVDSEVLSEFQWAAHKQILTILKQVILKLNQ